MDGLTLNTGAVAPGGIHTDFAGWMDAQRGRAFELHDKHVNPAFVKMLRTIGFDKKYVRGEGAYLWDADGTKYLDLLTGWGTFALGRNHPKIKEILRQLLDADTPNLVRMDCSLLSGLVAEKLTSHTTDGLSRVFFCNSGTEAVESALKFARCATGRQGIVYCDHAFHGLTGGSLAVNGAEFFRERFGSSRPAAHGAVQRPARPGAGAERPRRPRRSSSSRCRARAARWSPTGTWPRPSGCATSTAAC